MFLRFTFNFQELTDVYWQFIVASLTYEVLT